MAGNPPPDEVIAVCAKYCDAFTVDNYAPLVNAQSMSGTDKYSLPVIITETNRPIVGPGKVSGGWEGVLSSSPNGQAQDWNAYMNSAFQYGRLVGVYYYSALAEEPFSGNLYGEAVNAAFYTIANQPRPIVDTQLTIAESMYKTVFPNLIH